MKLAQKNEMIVPTFDIDLIWHSHMRRPSHYQKFSIAICGFVVDHDDSIEQNILSNNYQKQPLDGMQRTRPIMVKISIEKIWKDQRI
jgi:hypothetical protein